MLGNCEKMVLISSSTSDHEWSQPQNQIDEKGNLIDHHHSSAAKMMQEKPNNQDQNQQPQQPPHPPLKCPRCDSLNTKFCYYNNYSLTQPRHFCKACKRYWTRGGTLRNVPVGGGCRKNKRVKRPAASTTNEVTSTATSNPSHHVVAPSGQIDLTSSASANHISPLFYSLLTNNHHPPPELNLPYPAARFNSSINGYHDHLHQPQMNGLGLGFSSSGLLASDVNGNDYIRNVINSIPSNKQIQEDIVIPSNSLLSSYNNSPIFGSTSSTSATNSTMAASFIASSFQQQKMIFGGGFEGFDDNQMQPPRNGTEGSLIVKDVKMEEGGHSRLDWSHVMNNQNHIDDQINSSSSDPSLLWNATGVGSAWLDPSNVGSSVPSLI